MNKSDPKKKLQLKPTKKHTFVFWITIALLVGGIFGYECANNPDTEFFRGIGFRNNFFKTNAVLPENIELCFTPPSGCSAVIEREISKAISSIYVQAYGMTSPVITEALIKAHKRGVKVRVLLDKSNLKDKWSKRPLLVDAGVDVGINNVSNIAHNKIMIIDEETVITGSFNFTRAADNRNTENVIIINDKSVANEYLQNWLKRKSKNEFDR